MPEETYEHWNVVAHLVTWSDPNSFATKVIAKSLQEYIAYEVGWSLYQEKLYHVVIRYG